MAPIGERIMALRKAKKLNQTQLGEAVGLDQSTISDIEKRGAQFKAEVLLLLADTLGTTPHYIMRGDRGMSQDDMNAMELVEAFKRADEAGKNTIMTVARMAAQQAKPAPKPSRKQA